MVDGNRCGISNTQAPQKAVSTNPKPTPALQLAMILDQMIDKFWIYNDESFDLLHGIPVQGHRSLPRDQQFTRSLSVRQAADALYEVCQRSAHRYELHLERSSAQDLSQDSLEEAFLSSDISFFSCTLAGSTVDPKVGL